MASLTFKFDSDLAARHFWEWFRDVGTEYYWESMATVEGEEDGDVTGLDFDYSKADRGTVVVSCGRFTGPADVEEFDDRVGYDDITEE